MPVSELKLIKRCAEFLPRSQIKNIPHYRRGIYALLRRRPKLNAFDVVYIGIAAGTKTASIRGRLRTHEHSKGSLWTHFSIYEVWDNIREEEIRELEGIFRQYTGSTRVQTGLINKGPSKSSTEYETITSKIGINNTRIIQFPFFLNDFAERIPYSGGGVGHQHWSPGQGWRWPSSPVGYHRSFQYGGFFQAASSLGVLFMR